MEVFGFVPLGYEGELVKIEVDLRRGIPGMEIVGLPAASVREARERIRIAIQRSGFEYPAERILINLSPADVTKTGAGLDLPMALALLAATGQGHIPDTPLMALGELSLDGKVKPVSGTLPAVACGLSRGIDSFVVPFASKAEASCLDNCTVWPLENLKQLQEKIEGLGVQTRRNSSFSEELPEGFLPLLGHPKTVLGLEAVCAGGHSLLLYGPPGTGKTLAAKCLEEMGLPLTGTPALEATRLWSLAGLIPSPLGLLKRPPFRRPHHGCSQAGMVGGGKDLSPGEVSLAHRGVLFLDEAPEFAPHILQSLREPLEDGSVRLSRAGRSYWYPSRFSLVMTANNCPCGQLGKDRGLCLCGPLEVRRYWDRMGNALLDRVDLRIYMQAKHQGGEGESHLRKRSYTRLGAARQCQMNRGQTGDQPNTALTPEQLKIYAPLGREGELFLQQVCQKEDWSTRGFFGLWRLALTLADLDGKGAPNLIHFEQAVSLRKPEGETYWQN